MLTNCCIFLQQLVACKPCLISDSYGHSSNIIFNNKKTTCTVFGNARHNDVLLSSSNQRVPIVDSFKYLGVEFVTKIFYMLMFHPLNESFMQHVTVYLIKVGERVKLFNFN